MNTVRIYLDEVIEGEQRDALVHSVQSIQHVVDVELSDRDPHELVVEYHAQQNMPVKLIEALRSQGYHPDILSA